MATVRTSLFIGGTRISDNDFSSIHIRQIVASHHLFEIRLRQDASKGVLLEKVNSWIGQTVKIGIDYEKDINIILSPVKDIFKGIVTSLGLTRLRGTAEIVVRGESPTIVLDDGANTRSFTDKGLNEILDEVFSPYNGAFPQPPNIASKVFTETLPYCVQYKESNFAYAVRLANRYGEWFYYDGLDLFFGKPEGGEAIPLSFGESGLKYFDLSVKAFPTKFEMRAYDYTKHEQLAEEAPNASKTSDLGKTVLGISNDKIFNQVPSVSLQTAVEDGELKNMVERWEQISTDEMVLFSGSSSNPDLKVGTTIEVSDKIVGETYGSFIITMITHDIAQGGDYTNAFEAIPVEVGTPPLSTVPNPPFCETQLAKVTDVDDEDSLGRVKVKFLWQEGSDEKSPWIRVASPYTGKDKGFYIIPEVDDQVLVGFENNNPDKPYVLTGMYNNDAKPEWFDKKNRYKGFKSKGKNQWKFDDKNKSILISAPSAITMSAGKSITINTGGKEDSVIKLDAGMGTITVIAKTVNVEAAETITLNAQKQVEVTSGETIEINSGKSLDATGGETVTIIGGQTTSIEGSEINVGSSGTIDVVGNPIKLNS